MELTANPADRAVVPLPELAVEAGRAVDPHSRFSRRGRNQYSVMTGLGAALLYTEPMVGVADGQVRSLQCDTIIVTVNGKMSVPNTVIPAVQRREASLLVLAHRLGELTLTRGAKPKVEVWEKLNEDPEVKPLHRLEVGNVVDPLSSSSDASIAPVELLMKSFKVLDPESVVRTPCESADEGYAEDGKELPLKSRGVEADSKGLGLGERYEDWLEPVNDGKIEEPSEEDSGS